MNGKISRFEDLIAWQKARILTRAIYQTTRQGSLAKDYALCSQMQRAAVSIMSNISEGFERAGRAEFHQFLSIAKASCGELRSQLYVALDSHDLGQVKFDELYQLTEEEGRILGGLRAAVAQQRNQERKKL